jgi:hypothetical protein
MRPRQRRTGHVAPLAAGGNRPVLSGHAAEGHHQLGVVDHVLPGDPGVCLIAAGENAR